MTFIDAHVHIYPEKIAQRAVDSVLDFYSIPPTFESKGTGQSVIEAIDGSPITNCIVYSVAIKPSNVASINDFIASECAKHPQFYGFMAAHHELEEPEKEIERAMAMGLRGIKVHPDTQKVNADDPRLMDIYAIAEDKKLPVVIHTGDYRFDYSHPRRIREVLRAFPNLVVDAAHFGGWSIFDMGTDILRNERCFVDTSSSFQFVGLRHAKELINLYGSDRVMFGSDFPMWDPAREAEDLLKMNLTSSDLEKVSYKNALSFLGISEASL